jgi:hypothetical protein
LRSPRLSKQKPAVSSGFLRADDGIRTHDLLHGKQNRGERPRTTHDPQGRFPPRLAARNTVLPRSAPRGRPRTFGPLVGHAGMILPCLNPRQSRSTSPALSANVLDDPVPLRGGPSVAREGLASRSRTISERLTSASLARLASRCSPALAQRSSRVRCVKVRNL